MEALLFDRHEGVATLTLNRPQARNAIDMTLRQELGEAVLAVRDDPAVHALVITGAGGSFCAGGDLRSIQAGTPDVEAWRGRMRSSHAWFAQLLAMDKPVVCAVDGPAYGAGFGLALAGDFVLASTRARFCLSFMRVGLVPDFGIFYTLPRVVGVQRARELMLSAREVDADEALRLGIAMERLAPEALLPRAQALAAAPQGDLAAMLDIEANAQALCFMTDAHRDAVARFLNKQTPAFQWPAQPGEHS
ncbi:enoyl-CoA hydratase/isomerase family protein [Piscinibacter sakaiensis]|uniref:enoyl-CoA hydratase/isomerase family protein n=1 Tax=Piscinibacter sakaiensis TaxID=1547922 RepID=UPI0037292284